MPKSVRTSAAARIVSQSDLLPMTMATSGAGTGAAGLLALRECKSLLAIVVPQAFGFDDIVTAGRDFLVEADDLFVSHRFAVRFKAAAIVVDSEGFRHASGPHYGAAAVDHRQFQAGMPKLFQGVAEFPRRQIPGAEIEVHADDLDLRLS